MSRLFHLRLDGVAEVLASFVHTDLEILTVVRSEVADAAERVRRGAADTTGGYLRSPWTAAGYRVNLIDGGMRADVQQSLQKVSGLRPDWGGTQMRLSLLPALDDQENEFVGDMAAAIDGATRAFGGSGG